MMLYSVYMFFNSRGGLGFFVLLIGAAIFGTAKNKNNNIRHKYKSMPYAKSNFLGSP